ERVLEKQRIISTEGQDDQDVIAFASGEDETCAMTFFFRNGKLIGREFFILQGTRDSSPGEVMASFLQQFYESSPHIPPELVVEVEPDDRAVIQTWLREKRKGAITITAPKRGDKLRLIEMVKQNAREVLEQQRIKWLTDSQKTQLALEELQEALNLAAPPQRIECYDISNTQGTNSVGAMVVFEAGRPKTSEYRRFKIKTVEGPNDFASHQEVLRRRFRAVAKQASAEASAGMDVENALLNASIDALANAVDGVAEAGVGSDANPQPIASNGSGVPDAASAEQVAASSQLQHDWAMPD
ncbi:MAG TPA: hypothetical protein DDW33_06515, partial [Ktedonobacter sp.]|nr:hypothetical protein [Ktedonobacter sp.]